MRQPKSQKAPRASAEEPKSTAGTQTENELPQPQVLVTFGFVNLNPEP